jgi:hypothetical protein
MGRPSEFSPEVANEICERIAKGESLRAICKGDDQTAEGWMPNQATVYRWLASKEEWAEAFREQYARAREMQAETFVDAIVEIADATDEPAKAKLAMSEGGEIVVRDHNRDRLRIEARKWAASKLAPKKYGDKLDLTHAGEVGLKVEIVRFGDA